MSDVIHLSDPDRGPTYCGGTVTVIDAPEDNRPVCQTCHRGITQHLKRMVDEYRNDAVDLRAEVKRLREALATIAGATTIADAVPDVRAFARTALAESGEQSDEMVAQFAYAERAGRVAAAQYHPAPVVPDSADVREDEDGLLPVEQSLASVLWDQWSDPDGAPCVTIKDDPRTVARALRPWLLAVVGQGVTAERWGVYSYNDARWYLSDPPTREAAEHNHALLRADGEACDVFPERVGQAMQNAVAHARHRAAVRPSGQEGS